MRSSAQEVLYPKGIVSQGVLEGEAVSTNVGLLLVLESQTCQSWDQLLRKLWSPLPKQVHTPFPCLLLWRDPCSILFAQWISERYWLFPNSAIFLTDFHRLTTVSRKKDSFVEFQRGSLKPQAVTIGFDTGNQQQEGLSDELDARRDHCIPVAGLLPLFEHLEAYAGQSLQTDLASILQNFEKGAKMDSKFFFCQQESILQAEELLQRVPNLSLAVSPSDSLLHKHMNSDCWLGHNQIDTIGNLILACSQDLTKSGLLHFLD